MPVLLQLLPPDLLHGGSHCGASIIVASVAKNVLQLSVSIAGHSFLHPIFQSKRTGVDPVGGSILLPSALGTSDANRLHFDL